MTITNREGDMVDHHARVHSDLHNGRRCVTEEKLRDDVGCRCDRVDNIDEKPRVGLLSHTRMHLGHGNAKCTTQRSKVDGDAAIAPHGRSKHV